MHQLTAIRKSVVTQSSVQQSKILLYFSHFGVKNYISNTRLNYCRETALYQIKILSTAAELYELECGPMPNVMVALLNIDGVTLASCAQRRKVWLAPTARVQCSK